jgi:hypothetical protein
MDSTKVSSLLGRRRRQAVGDIGFGRKGTVKQDFGLKVRHFFGTRKPLLMIGATEASCGWEAARKWQHSRPPTLSGPSSLKMSLIRLKVKMKLDERLAEIGNLPG